MIMLHSSLSRRGLLGGAAAAAAMPLRAARADSSDLVILSLGGSYQEAQSALWFKPFAAASGVHVTEAAGYNYAQLKVMIESGNTQADLIDTSADSALALHDAGLLEPIDWSVIPAAFQSGIPADMKLSYAFPTIQWAMVMAYNTDKFPAGTAPKTWADFWNVRDFPGKRGSIGATRPPVEQAALAMNGDMAKLYPINLDAAFNKIRELGDNLIFADGYAQLAQYLSDGEIDLAIIPNGRLEPMVRSGRPVAINWNQHLRFANFFTIPRGAPNVANAGKFLGFVANPQRLAELAAPQQYGAINVDAFQYIPAALQPLLPGNPATAAMGREFDATWSGTNRAAVARGWARMAAR
jgi:putative spermidine/putrescine transport system substrate-binding protein